MTNLARRAFRMSLFAYPREFRNNYADEMEVVFYDRLRDVPRGAAGMQAVREIVDVLISAARLRFAYNAITRPALTAAIVVAMLGTMVLRNTPTQPPARVDFMATDPAGQFTISVANGKPIAATIDRVRVPLDRVVHHGDSIHVLNSDGRVVLAVAYDAEQGRIEWNARPVSCRGHALDCAL